MSNKKQNQSVQLHAFLTSNRTTMDWQLGLNFIPSVPIIFNPLDFFEKRLKKKLTSIIDSNKYHVYILCKRKKIYFQESKPDGPDFNLTSFYFLDDNHNKISNVYRHSSELTIHTHDKENGSYDISLRGAPGSIRDFELTNIFFNIYAQYETAPDKSSVIYSDLEVMYIGQSYGKKARKKIDYRIAKHEKVQEIALSITNSGSNEEVIAIGVVVNVRDLATSFSPYVPNAQVPSVESITKTLKALQQRAKARIAEDQEITVFEASLIRYFQPKLNTEYKKTFPSPGFPSYQDLYNTTFNYSTVEINTGELFARLYSKIIPERKYVHLQHYPLTSLSEKEDFFSYLYELASSQQTPMEQTPQQ